MTQPGGKVEWPLSQESHTPKLVLGCPLDSDVKQMRRLKQVGVDYASTGGWTTNENIIFKKECYYLS